MNCSRASLPEPKKGEIDFKNLALLKAVAMKNACKSFEMIQIYQVFARHKS